MAENAAFDPIAFVARELSLAPAAVATTLRLLDEGHTVPFLARYRKEATGSLDEVQIRTIGERAAYLRELEQRRAAVRQAIAEQGQLTAELEARLAACATKAALEDLYLPFKPKRRTRATIARERGLLPLAAQILAQPRNGRPEQSAAAFVAPEADVADVAAALAGACDIVAEMTAEDANVRAAVRRRLGHEGVLSSKKARKAPDGRTPFEDFYDFRQPLRLVPPHRYLALRRGEAEDVLSLSIVLEPEHIVPDLLRLMRHDPRSPFAALLDAAVRDSVERLLLPSLSSELQKEHKAAADEAAIGVFAENLRHLLRAAPFGPRPVVGIDPGLRTGCKCAAVDLTGAFLGHMTIYPHAGGNVETAVRELDEFVARHKPDALAIGNGTGGRETERFVRRALAEAHPPLNPSPLIVLVDESGASVYSASDGAREEFPHLDLTVRGAISIARRLQDPLAELVKIEPRSMGVGQYQHDVDAKRLQERLDAVVESVVNEVGVELNTASASLLAYVAGVGPALARAVVVHRTDHGPFACRQQLRKVAKFGPRAFEQAAGFLRIQCGQDPLDSSAVHPERYALVEKMAKDLHLTVRELIGRPEAVARIDWQHYRSAEVGEPTLRDILAELAKPGRDPRATFEPPAFRDDVQSIDDLQVGMVLAGIVTNVTAFGAFVDIGVHRDGLIHISQLADRFVRDPATIARVGQKITVRVTEIDRERHRIGLSARLIAS